MSWSSGFRDALKKTSLTPKYELRFYLNPTGPGGVFSIFGGYEASSEWSGNWDLFIDQSGPRINGQSVTLQSWSINFGSFIVPVVGDLTKLFPTMCKGSFASLFVELDGVKERVCFGQLVNISGIGPSWNLEFVDLVSSLQRVASGTLDISEVGSISKPIPYGKFMRYVGQTTTANANYTHGVSTTISVSELKFFENQNGENGLAKLDIGGNTVYFEWTAKSAATGSGTLTLSTASKAGTAIFPGTTGLSNFSSGAVITACALVKGKPFDFFGYFLLSRTGTNTNAFDKFPSSWSAQGNFPTDLYDGSDTATCEDWLTANPTSTDYKWTIPYESALDAGMRTFTDQLSAFGLWPVWRQNAVSFRGARDLQKPNAISRGWITDKNIIRINDQSIFSMDARSVYLSLYFNLFGVTNYATAITQTEAKTLPYEARHTIDSSLFYDTSVTGGHLASGDIARLKKWYFNPVMTVSMTLPIEFCYLCAGDIVSISSRYLYSYSGLNNAWLKQKAMVTDVSYEFQSGKCDIVVATYWEIIK